MAIYVLALLQQPSSPLAGLTRAALDLAGMAPGLTLAGEPPSELAGQTGLVLWDLSGTPEDRCERLARDLAPVNLGVVMLAQDIGPDTRLLAARCGALNLVPASAGAQGLAAALELSAAALAGIAAGRREVARLEAETADRLALEEAKRLVMLELGLGEVQAMKWLQKRSRDTNQRLPDLARKIISGESALGGGRRP